MVRSGSTVTFYADGQTGGTFRPDVGSLRSQVIATLSQYFIVREVTIEVKTMLGSVPLIGPDYDYRATVQFTTKMDYGHVDDLGSVVANAFYIAGGALPVVSSEWHDGPFGGVENTGGFSVGDALKPITDLPKLLVFGLIVIVALVAFSPLGKAGVRVSAV